jgi:hypothetical protein
VSEYQFYEFQTVDRRLTERETQALRRLSSRAIITPVSFTNVYVWGDFRGSPRKLMEQFFDAFLYVANWGTRCLSFRFSEQTVDLTILKRYCRGENAKVRSKGRSIIIDLTSEDEEGDSGEEGEGRLSSLLALRADVTAGDLRPLYLCWLMSVSAGGLNDDEKEPPCPAGLRQLKAAHESLIDFMRIDRDLVAVAAANTSPSKAGPRPRKVGELRAAAAAHAEARKSAERQAAARRRVEGLKRAKAARARRLADLAGREPEAWRQIDALIANKEPASYRQVVKLLLDLRDLAALNGGIAEVAARIQDLRRTHASKPSLLRHLTEAGFDAISLRRLS